MVTSMAIVRSAINASTYVSLNMEPTYMHNLNNLIKRNPVDSITKYKNIQVVRQE